jgi:hypothetical protein
VYFFIIILVALGIGVCCYSFREYQRKRKVQAHANIYAPLMNSRPGIYQSEPVNNPFEPIGFSN